MLPPRPARGGLRADCGRVGSIVAALRPTCLWRPESGLALTSLAGMYRNLDPARIVETAVALRRRIDERFPASGLGKVARELVGICEEAAALSGWLARPNWWLRSLVGLALLVLTAALVGAVLHLQVEAAYSSLSDLVQGLEAAVNDAIFIAFGVFFLVSWESRRKRRRALAALHVLRSIAHIIDMHQLTKDPERVTGASRADTRSSPQRAMSSFELTRYLDYCSELLAIVSKVAALYVQRFQDPVTLQAVNEVESLASGLSRTVWQKIMILDRVAPDRVAPDRVAPDRVAGERVVDPDGRATGD